MPGALLHRKLQGAVVGLPGAPDEVPLHGIPTVPPRIRIEKDSRVQPGRPPSIELEMVAQIERLCCEGVGGRRLRVVLAGEIHVPRRAKARPKAHMERRRALEDAAAVAAKRAGGGASTKSRTR